MNGGRALAKAGYDLAVSFFGRLFSWQHRRAAAAEATGNFREAARRYALSGELDDVARMHLLLSERAPTRKDEIEALRDAHRVAKTPGLKRRAALALARALVARVKAEGLSTEKDRQEVREAARLFGTAGEHAPAGETWELVLDLASAARAYEQAGAIDKMEEALAREAREARRTRDEKATREDYEQFERTGDRDAALGALRRLADLGEGKGEYRRMAEELAARRRGQGRIELRLGPSGLAVVLCGASRVVLGRDPSCDLVLRSGGVSREHAHVLCEDGGFVLGDLGSRNGTLLSGLPIAALVPLSGRGAFALGDACEITFSEKGRALTLTVTRGLDQGKRLVVCAPGVELDLLALLELPGTLVFRDGHPALECKTGALILNGQRIARGAIEPVGEDAIVLGDIEVTVL
jgi:tetratricopeptide (TPR) repeat protein